MMAKGHIQTACGDSEIWNATKLVVGYGLRGHGGCPASNVSLSSEHPLRSP